MVRREEALRVIIHIDSQDIKIADLRIDARTHRGDFAMHPTQRGKDDIVTYLKWFSRKICFAARLASHLKLILLRANTLFDEDGNKFVSC